MDGCKFVKLLPKGKPVISSATSSSARCVHQHEGKTPLPKEVSFSPLMRYSLLTEKQDQKPADVSTAFAKLPCLTHMKPNREKIEAEELVKERLPLTKWELTPKEKEDFDRVMRLMFDAANILRYDLELGEDAIGKTLKELADWATN